MNERYIVTAEELLSVLKQAYTAGWEGYQDVAYSTARKLLQEFIAKVKQYRPMMEQKIKLPSDFSREAYGEWRNPDDPQWFPNESFSGPTVNVDVTTSPSVEIISADTTLIDSDAYQIGLDLGDNNEESH